MTDWAGEYPDVDDPDERYGLLREEVTRLRSTGRDGTVRPRGRDRHRCPAERGIEGESDSVRGERLGPPGGTPAR